MSEIIIIEKPEWISFDDIHELLFVAHTENREKRGFTVQSTEKTGDQLKEMIGTDGKCFVALDGQKLVGTVSFRIIRRNYWCAKGMVADRILVAVHPEYQGRHVSAALFQAVEKAVRKQGLRYIVSTTAEKNDVMRKVCQLDGFMNVDFKAPHSDHYNVVMLKWLDGCPYPKWRTQVCFGVKQFLIKLRYKPGRIRRF